MNDGDYIDEMFETSVKMFNTQETTRLPLMNRIPKQSDFTGIWDLKYIKGRIVMRRKIHILFYI